MDRPVVVRRCGICDQVFLRGRRSRRSACPPCRLVLARITESKRGPAGNSGTVHGFLADPGRVARVERYRAIVAAGGRLFE